MHFAHVSSPPPRPRPSFVMAAREPLARPSPASPRLPANAFTHHPAAAGCCGGGEETDDEDGLRRLTTETDYKGKPSESRDAALYASHPAETDESRNIF